MKISANPNVNENEPSFIIIGVHHAREPISCNVTVDFARYLCENYNSDPTIHWLLDNREIYIVPVENPDGYIWN
ncbi:peptidase M14, partial [candidate division WOR-3 bacterium]|nr:peptidase M14 [candidate division WOR-3 bacterium]